jgi:hypothetical protein
MSVLREGRHQLLLYTKIWFQKKPEEYIRIKVLKNLSPYEVKVKFTKEK